MWGAHLAHRGVILWFLNQYPSSVAVWGLRLLETARAAGLPLAEVAWLRGRRRGASFPLADLTTSKKGCVCLPAGEGGTERDAFKGKGTSVSLVEKAVPRARAAQGYVHGSSLLLLIRQRVLVALEAKKEGKKKKRVIKIFQILYAWRSVVRVLQTSRRCDQTADHLFIIMRAQSLTAN